MSSSVFPSGIFYPEKTIGKASKEFQISLPSPATRTEMLRSLSIPLRPHQLEDSCNLIGRMLEPNQFVKLDSTVRRPVLVDVQVTRPDSVLFSFDINEKCGRYSNITKFLMSEPKEAGRVELDYSLMSDLTGLCKLETNMHQQPLPSDYGFCFYDWNDERQSSRVCNRSELYSQKPRFDFVGDFARSKIMVDTDGQLLYLGSQAEMNDLLSVVSEFYLSKNASVWRNSMMLVPQLPRVATSEARAYDQVSSLETTSHQQSSLKVEAVTVAPLKSPKKFKLKPAPKKKSSRKAWAKRDEYKRSYFHACESLMSLVLDKSSRKNGVLLVKKSGPEVPQVLTQFSASIAGTGLAVLFSVLCKLAGGRVPFCASKMLNTGFGFGLVWLSCAVNKLRDNIVYVSKSTKKSEVKDDEEMMRRLDRSVNEIFFRAATLMAFAVLKLA